MYTKSINRELSAIADSAKETNATRVNKSKGITVNQALFAVLAITTALAIVASYCGWIPANF